MLETLAQIKEKLEERAYTTMMDQDGDALFVTIEVTDDPWEAILTVQEGVKGPVLDITCNIATIGELASDGKGGVDENRAQEILAKCCEAFSRTKPVGFTLLTAQDLDDDLPESDYPVVLTDTVQMGDLNEVELFAEFESIEAALVLADQEGLFQV